MSASCDLSCNCRFSYINYKKPYTCEMGKWTYSERPCGIHMRRKNFNNNF